jgi:ATP-dependent helicase YprA (DUF1998 family)
MTPLGVDQRLRERVTEAVIAQGAFRHETLNAFLRERLSSKDVHRGALFAEPVVEGAAPYLSSHKSPQDLLGKLLSPELVEALTDGSAMDSYRFDYPAYEHQLKCWELLLDSKRNSVLVSSGTGSGKTECFLVPLLEDLAREAVDGSRLSGVRALMLYPLNALIASQEERLRSWARPFGGRIRFGLYNGLMRDRRKSDREKAESEVPEQVLYRTTLRADPPPILVTNNTMLEYMTIRREDLPIVEQSRGLLRWIIIDEAHSYIGSAAAELSLLLRRVLHTFGVTADQVRFVATSATIGGSDESAKEALQQYLADLAGVHSSKVHVVFGQREQVALPPPRSDLTRVESDAPGQTIAAHPSIQGFVREAESRPVPISRVGAFAANAGLSPDGLIEVVAKKRSWPGRSDEAPLLPLRVHKFVRAIPGLWSCLNPSCSGTQPPDWPFGGLLFDKNDSCPHCSAPAYELFSCRECGEAWLSGFDHGGRFTPGSIADDSDEFAAASAREDDGASGEDEDQNSQTAASTLRSGRRRLIGTRQLNGLREVAIDPTSGELPERRDGLVVWMSGPVDDGACPNCHAGPTATAPSPLWSFRFGAPFLIQNAMPTLLEGVSPSSRSDLALPAEGRQVLSFTDSRQGTARFAANIETISERSYVRGFVYHAVQKSGSDADPGQRAALEKEIGDLREAAAANPSLAALTTILAQKEAQLASAGRPTPIPWSKMVKALADDPMINQWVRSVWEERDERFRKNPEAFAQFLLLRELARRPRRANALETLGLAKLVIPTVESLSELQRPELFKAKQLSIADWRDFLYFLVDNTIRSRFALNIARDDARWLLPRHAFLRSIVGPDDELQTGSDYRWPLSSGGGPKPSAVLLLEEKLGLDSSSGENRALTNDALRAAWAQLSPLLRGIGQTYALDFDKVAIAVVEDAWLCPVTHRTLPRLALGRTPYGLRNNPPGARERPDVLHFPQLPFPFPRSSDQREALATFVASDACVQALRAKGAWHNIHDRAATFAPYIRAEEHSAQQPPWRLREFEREFKAGEINMLACSTTMEMGVDIGSVEAVLNTNVPPSIANYRQRVGRAGRRRQSFSSSLTLARDTRLDREAFRDPVKYLTRDLRAPRVTLDSERIVQRHVNALLLAHWFKLADGHLVRVKAGDFFGFPQSFAMEPDEAAPAVRFAKWLRDPTTAVMMTEPVRSLTAGTAISGRADLLERAADMFDGARAAFSEQWTVLRDLVRSASSEAKTGIEIQARRMCREPLLSELAQRSLLPGSGFPTAVLPFINECKEAKSRDRGSDEQDEINRNRRYDYPSRSADIAIREYAPGAEVVIDGLVWSSAGVTLNWRRPAHDAEAREIQSIRHSWSCCDCRESGCSMTKVEACPDCGSAALEHGRFLEPAGFRMDWNDTPHADTDNVTYIEPERPRISVRGAAWEPLLDPEHGRARASGDGLVLHLSRGATKRGYRVCLDCGRAEADADGALVDHKPLIPLKGDRGRCPGNEKTFAITEPIALGYEVLTDVAELQPSLLDDEGAAWALASAVREALSRRLGIEARELGVAAEERVGSSEEKTHSLFFYDRTSGGAGYAPRLLDDLAGILSEAREILNCPVGCERSCSACVLAADLYAEQESLDRRVALQFLERLLEEIAEPKPEDVAGPDSRLSPPASDAIVRRVRAGDLVIIFANGDFDLGVLEEPPFSTLFANAQKCGAKTRLVIREADLEQMDEALRRGLRNASHRHRFEVWMGTTPVGTNGAPMISFIGGAANKTAFFTRDENAVTLGPNWGVGLAYPVVSADLSDVPEIRPVGDDALERQLRSGARVKLIEADPGRPLRLFGNGLMALIKPELQAAGAWKPGQLKALEYSDRYVKSPLTAVLAIRTMRALKDALAASEAVKLSIQTEPLKPGNYSGYPRQLRHDWRDERTREEVLRRLAERLGFPDYRYSKEGAPHGRKLTIAYADGTGAVVLFDQGFGYWRAASGDAHDFMAPSTKQVDALLNSSAFVRGVGESYVAVATR